MRERESKLLAEVIRVRTRVKRRGCRGEEWGRGGGEGRSERMGSAGYLVATSCIC